MLVCLIFCKPLLRLVFGAVEEDVMNGAVRYFLITVIAYPFLALFDVGAAFYRAGGNFRFPMMISVISNTMNIAGNAILIFGLGMGVAGAALSILFSRIFAAGIVLFYLRKPQQVIVLRDYFKIRPDMPLISKILSIGIPAGVENGMFQFGKLAIQSTESTLGTQAIAAQALAIVLENLNGIASMGVGISLMTVAGQTFGAGRTEEGKYYIVKLTWYGEIGLILSCLLTFAVGRPIMYLAGMEPESMRMCYEMLVAITIAKPLLWALGFIPAYGLRAAGDVKFSMIVSICTMWFCRVALAIYLIRFQGFGPIAVWIGMFADWGIRSIIFSIRFMSGKWMENHVI